MFTMLSFYILVRPGTTPSISLTNCLTVVYGLKTAPVCSRWESQSL